MSLTISMMAYDFVYDNCYYEIVSVADRTARLVNEKEYDYRDDTPSTAYFVTNFTVPSTVTYQSINFTVTDVKARFINCKKLVINPNVLNAELGGMVDSLIITDSYTPLEELEAEAKYAFMGRDISPWNHLSYGFYYCSFLEKICFGDSVTYIPGAICSECANLKEVVISNNVKVIYDGAFYGCYQMTHISGKGIEKIYHSAFQDCSTLIDFDFPHLQYIEDDPVYLDYGENGTFQGCSSLQNVNLPIGFSYIGKTAFMDCANLESVFIPSTITHIGELAFSNCPKLSVISIGNSDPIAIDESTFSPTTYLTATLKVPVGCRDKYANASTWKNFANIVEDASIISDQHAIFIDHIYGKGAVKVLNASTKEPISFVSTGEKVIVQFYPDENYYVGGVDVNGIDMTSQVVDNQLTLTIDKNTTINVDFYHGSKPIDEDPIYLSIKQADNGCVKLEVYEWETYNLLLEAAEGWEIHSVSYNSIDVTDNVINGKYTTPYIEGNSELVVTYVQQTSSNKIVKNSNIKVLGYNDIIMVENAKHGTIISVYTIDGLLIENRIANGGQEQFKVNQNCVYVIKVGNEVSYKLFL